MDCIRQKTMIEDGAPGKHSPSTKPRRSPAGRTKIRASAKKPKQADTTKTQMLRIAVLASHEGTTLQSIIDACATGRIRGVVVAVISNNSGSGALRRARTSGIAAHHLSPVTHGNHASLDTAICEVLQSAAAEVLFLGGYMKRLGPRTLTAFHGRVLNTHPALLPKFGGHGMFGDHVFESVLAAGESESGASVHLVDSEYDTGGVVRQGRVPVLPGDTVESLKARVSACERELVVNTLAAIADGRLALETVI